jgi:pimeloyl-ACP methyl ester carboxylesterase
MLRFVITLGVTAGLPGIAVGQTPAAPKPAPSVVRYGHNAAAGKTFTHDGVRLYYEVYGGGEPVLLVHGNGGSIGDLTAQIDHFRKRYTVIAMDSRDQGRSADSAETITYEKMTDDLAALLDHLKTGPVNVLGWSDGGIEALLLGIRHPAKVKKIAAMAANLNPTEEAVTSDVIGLVKEMLNATPPDSPEHRRERKVTELMLSEPHIDAKALQVIAAPTLVLAGDHDLIRLEHIVDIYNHVPNGQLAIFPSATHMVPFDDPATFNAVVDRFFRTPFVKKDRIQDTMKSLERMRSAPKPPTPFAVPRARRRTATLVTPNARRSAECDS